MTCTKKGTSKSLPVNSNIEAYMNVIICLLCNARVEDSSLRIWVSRTASIADRQNTPAVS
jgi:hypothetical protein